jgi:type II secretory pathway predicted ATPase ExeA
MGSGMYNSYFGFSQSPFENNLDQRFLFLSKDHREVLGALLYFAETKQGFAIVCGDVGTGKSMLINAVLDRLPDSAQPIMMLTPHGSSLDILNHIAEALEVKVTAKESVQQLTDKVKKSLTSAEHRKKSFLLIIDEAHLLSDQDLEEILQLSNIETYDQKLLQILLVGQHELSHKLDRPEMRHLRKRINVNRFLSPLNPEETFQYIDHRLKQVGSSFAVVFEDQCRSLIFKLTSGCPRLVNQLCDNALLIGMTEGRRKVNREVLQEAHETWKTDKIFTAKSSRALTYRGRRVIKPRVVLAGSVVVLVLLGIIAMRSGWGLVTFQSVFQKIRAAIPFAAGPPTASVETNADLQAARKSTQLGQSGELEGASEPSLKPSASPPKTAPLPAGFGRMKIEEPISPGEPLALSSPGQSEIKPESAGEPKLAAEIVTKKEEQAKPQGPLPELGETPKNKEKVDSGIPEPPSVQSKPGDEPPATEPLPAPLAFEQLVTQGGESLTRIASQHYPEDPRFGISAMILQNPHVTKVDVIKPGEVLYFPKINFENRTIQLKDNLWYTFYGRYPSPQRANQIASWLITKKIKFLERDIKNGTGNTITRIFIGGYATEEELAEALKNANLKLP